MLGDPEKKTPEQKRRRRPEIRNPPPTSVQRYKPISSREMTILGTDLRDCGDLNIEREFCEPSYGEPT